MIDDATRAQRRAADPNASTWLSANAGSGKTRVLTDRVARLLLGGVSPENILCLTYTKAAASEMQNRLFKRLGEWAMQPGEALRAALADVGETDVEDPARARTLFARAIETPGGLKIQTIHSFCTSILRRFPLEAGVTPRFKELDEGATARLVREVLDTLSVSNKANIAEIAEIFTGEDLVSLAQSVASQRHRFHARTEAKDLFGLPPEFDESTLLAQTLTAGDADVITSAIPLLQAESTNDQKLARKLELLPSPLGLSALPRLEDALLTGAKTKDPFQPKKQPTKATREGPFARLAADFDDLAARVAAARPLRLALAAANATGRLHRFAELFLSVFAEAKTAQGVLDFDDLILKARDLLTDPSVAAWVLYRLDGGIDHILVDEAQDTSPVQWSVIKALAEEMSAGQGTNPDRERTLFVVGDKKQSIYSFQGADPSSFDTVADEMQARLAADQGLNRRTLEYSFRSAPSILRAVDTVFTGDMRQGLGLEVHHRAFHEHQPGRVDLWPLTQTDDEADPPAWYDPVDTPSAQDPNVRLADDIAQEIARMTREETLPDEKTGRRAVRPGDVLILVQGRSALFHQIIRALKDADLPVAGADRLKVGASLAVRDVMALLSFLALPEDDLSLAAALKSPLFGWSEDDLYRLAQGRPGHLWPALRGSDAHPKTLEMLRSLRKDADFTRPFELIDRILSRMGGRRRLLARLGPEAEDGLNELLNQALVYETQDIPSLAGFVAWMQAGDVDVKRQSDASGTLIRVMTVHGAKGLEAPIVFLPDTMRAESRAGRDPVIVTEGGDPIWAMPSGQRDALSDAAQRRLSEKDAEERRRLLYVAMTRAENWLIVCGAAKKRDPVSAWHEVIEAGLTGAGATAFPFAVGEGLRLENGDWITPAAQPESSRAPALPPLPAFTDAAPGVPLDPVLNPSQLGGAKTLPGAEADPDSTARGTAVHKLLEVLPGQSRETWEQIANAVADELALNAAEILEEAAGVLTDSRLADFFEPPALTEAELTAPLPDGAGRIAGSVDRLVLDGDRVLLIDYKTNRDVPSAPEDVPEGLKRQMGAYLFQAEAIFPDKEIELILLWTHTRTITALPHGIVRSALSEATTS